MFIVNNRKFFYVVSLIIILASIVSLFVWGLNLGIDFKGGSLIEVNFATQENSDIKIPTIEDIKEKLSKIDLGEYSVRPTGDTGYIFRMREISGTEHQTIISLLESIDSKLKIEEKRFDSVGPLLGGEALRKSYISIFLVIICIVLFITFAFRKVSEPISSWKYGVIAILALLHDVIVPVGVFSFLGHYKGVEIDTLFVTALLVILGFSIHDTIVVFDRVRENLKHRFDTRDNKTFEQIVGDSISQTFTRSINTSLTTLLSLVALYFIGGESTRYFSLALMVGIIAGTYSSIFLGSPLLVTVEKWQSAKRK